MKALQVMEGDNVLITTANLHLVLDYHKYGIRESGIIFQVIEPPSYGTLYIDIWPRKDNTFTLLDLSRDKVNIYFNIFVQAFFQNYKFYVIIYYFYYY